MHFLKSWLSRRIAFWALVAALVGGSVGLAPAQIVQAAGSITMYSMGVYYSASTCTVLGQHCNFATLTIKNYYPTPSGCFAISYKNVDATSYIKKVYGDAFTLWLDDNLGGGTHRYGWGIPTRMWLLESDSHNANNWKFFKYC